MTTKTTPAGKTAKVIATLFVACGLIFSSCKKEAGPKGDTGPAGANGNANVTSYTVNTTASNWTFSAPSWSCMVNFPQLTTAIANGGVVAGYWQSGANWIPLPKVTYISSTVSSKMQYDFTTAEVHLYFTYSDNSTPPTPGTQVFRFVLIPPAMIKPNVNYDNFDDVRSAYKLTD